MGESEFDYRSMLVHYIWMVRETDGVDFIPPPFSDDAGNGSGFTPEEWAELLRLAEESWSNPRGTRD